MRILLDTHILLWSIAKPEKLPKAIRTTIQDPDHAVMFSAVSIWEIAIKAALRRQDFAVDPTEILTAAIASGFVELPLTAAVAARLATLPHHQADPFDRVIVAQAMAESLQLYTVDRQLHAYSPLVRLIKP